LINQTNDKKKNDDMIVESST